MENFIKTVELHPGVIVHYHDPKPAHIKRFNIRGDVEIHLGKGAHCNMSILTVIGSGHRIQIGASCVIQGEFGVAGPQSQTIKIGDRFSCGSTRFLAKNGNITVGHDVLFSRDITLRTSDMHAIFDIETEKRINPSKDIVIGNHVWIAEGGIIGKGANIGDGSVIGARSLVTGRIPSNVVAAGAPARVLKTGIIWDRRDTDDFPR